MTFLKFKLGRDGFTGLYQVNGRGPWRSEYKTDTLLANGTYDIFDGTRKVGEWVQDTLGHELKGN